MGHRRGSGFKQCQLRGFVFTALNFYYREERSVWREMLESSFELSPMLRKEISCSRCTGLPVTSACDPGPIGELCWMDLKNNAVIKGFIRFVQNRLITLPDEPLFREGVLSQVITVVSEHVLCFGVGHGSERDEVKIKFILDSLVGYYNGCYSTLF